MHPVLEPPAVPRSPEAIAAGNVVLRAALASVLALLTVAGALTAGVGSPAVREDVAARPLPFTAAVPFDAAQWTGAEAAGGRLNVVARGSNGAVALIEGGEGWSDYTVRARLRWDAGRQLEVHVRESGPADHVACVLEGGTARIDEVVGGVTRTIASVSAPEYAGRAFDAVVVADGRRVGFAVDGGTLLTAEVANRRGTAGIGVWDATWGKGAATAEYVRVESAIAALAPVADPQPGPTPKQTLGSVE